MNKIYMVLGIIILSPSSALASGYEKAVFWGGEWGGVANAATSAVGGANSVYFNPAGLATTRSTEISANLSGAFLQFQGPVFTAGSEHKTGWKLVPTFGALGSHQLRKGLGIGAGIYAAGGSKVDYGNVDASATGFDSFDPLVKGSIELIEIALGAGYEVWEGFRVGAVWRISMVSASLSSALATSTALVETQLNDLSDTKLSGFRFGIQYSPKGANWGIGSTLRTAVSFKAEGTGGGRMETLAAPGTVETLSSNSVSAENTFPWSWALGGHWKMSELLTLFSEYSFTNYSANRVLDLEGAYTSSLSGTPIALPDVPQSWRNLHGLRLGAEYRGLGSWVLRGGYALANAVTSPGDANALFEAPGSGHTFTLGTGTRISENMRLDFSADYATSSREVSSTEVAGLTLPGTYKTAAISAHASLKYQF